MADEYGQIILVPVADGRGNVSPHPAVILSPTDQIVPGAKLRVLCVSIRLEESSPQHHVPLPSQRPHTPRPA
jgi:hypothetical protein